MSLAVAGGSFAAAQDEAATPPKVIQITREWLKPGKSFLAHEKASVAFVNFSAKAKLQGHYVALDAMTGKPRSVFIARYPSFEAWEKDNKIVDKSPSLIAEVDRAIVGVGDFDDGIDQEVFTYNEELSYHPRPDLSHARYYQISVFHVRPGHRKEWNEVVKMYQAACDKAYNGAAHWGTYEAAYGVEDGTFLALSHRDSMKEIDEINAAGGKFVEAMGGEEAMQKFDELLGQAVDSSRTELFSINPRQSYPEEAWIKGDPDFWKPKAKAAEAAAAKPAAAKPAPVAAKPGGR
jgi:hypothetical protein